MGHLEKVFGLAACFPAQFHVKILSGELIGRLAGEAFLVSGSEDLAHNFRCGIHDQVHHFFFHFGDHAGLIEFHSLTGFNENVLCVTDSLLDVFLRLGVAGETAFFDDALGIGIRFAKDLLAAGFGLGELLFDLRGVRLASSMVRRRSSKMAITGAKANFLRIM